MMDLACVLVTVHMAGGENAEAVTLNGEAEEAEVAEAMDSSQPREVEVQRMAEAVEVLENR